ncbi:MAG: hypothetical protein U0V74_03780 [Chitinophagales bacterium]
MKIYSLTLLLCLLSIGSFAQTDAAKKSASRGTTQSADDIPNIDIDSASIVLTIPSSATDGTNGAGLAYDPVKKLYYSAFAGNVSYPMVVFDAKGNVVSADASTIIDVRGLWYNAKTSSIEANGYAEFGIVKYAFDKKGIPVSTTPIFSGKNQPDDNSVGVFDPVHNEILFLEMDENYATIYRYSRSTGKEVGKIELDELDYLGSYNNTAIAYTGIKGAEIAIVDYEVAIIYLFDVSSGKMVKQVTLPLDAVVEERFNFTFTNGMFWFFDTAYREWVGYKMPKQ